MSLCSVLFLLPPSMLLFFRFCMRVCACARVCACMWLSLVVIAMIARVWMTVSVYVCVVYCYVSYLRCKTQFTSS